MHAPKSRTSWLVMVTETDSVTLLYVLLPVALPVIPTLAIGQLMGTVSLRGKFVKSFRNPPIIEMFVFSNSFVRSHCHASTAPLGLVMLMSAVMCQVSCVVEGLYPVGTPPFVVFVIVLLIMFTWLLSTT